MASRPPLRICLIDRREPRLVLLVGFGDFLGRVAALLFARRNHPIVVGRHHDDAGGSAPRRDRRPSAR